MQPPVSPLARVPWALVSLVIGAILIGVAYVQAGAIPFLAHDDFGALVRAQGGSLSSPPEYPSMFRQVAAAARMLQNAYLGVTGVVLVTIGAARLVGARRDAST